MNAAIVQGSRPEGPLDNESSPARTPMSRRFWNRLSQYGPELAVALPLLALAITTVVHRSTRTLVSWDLAIFSLQVQDASHLQLTLGPYSRFHWHHPGPMFAYWLVPFAKLSGNAYWGLALGTAVLNLIGVVLIVVLAKSAADHWDLSRRAVGWAAATTLLFFMFLIGPDWLRFPWNPIVAIVPTAAVGFAAMAVISRVRWALPTMVVTASFAVQTHLGTAPIVFVWGATALVWLLIGDRHELAKWKSSFLVSAILAVGCWSPPLWQQFRDASHGNLSAIIDFALHDHVDHPGLGQVAKMVGIEASGLHAHLGSWLLGRHQTGSFGLVTVVVVTAMIALLATGAFRYLRASPRTRAAPQVVALASLPAMVVSARSIAGELYPYLTSFALGAGIVIWFATLLTVVQLGHILLAASPDRRVALARTGFASLLVASIVIGCLGLSAHAVGLGPAGAAQNDHDIDRFAPTVIAIARHAPGRPLLFEIGPQLPQRKAPWTVVAGLANELTREGYTVEVPQDWTYMFGARRSPRPGNVRLAFVDRNEDIADVDTRRATLLKETRTFALYLITPTRCEPPVHPTARAC